MTNWKPIETAPFNNEVILATIGTKSVVHGIDLVKRVKTGWVSTLFTTVYNDSIAEGGHFSLLRWMPIPPLHLSEDDEVKQKTIIL